MDKPIFIVGIPRSGSTLWANVVTRSPEVFRIGEMLFLTPWRKDFRYFLRKWVGDLSVEENVDEMVELMFSRRMLRGINASFWNHDIRDLDDPELREQIKQKIMASDRSLESFFKILVETSTAFRGYDRFCVKFPVYLNHVARLREWYPDCKIVHIIRDPRANAISRADAPNERVDPGGSFNPYRYFRRKVLILYILVQYIWTSRMYVRNQHEENYALFRYEDLLAEPEDTIKRLCEFTEVEYTPDMLNPKQGQASSVTKVRSGGLNKKAASHWKKVISPFENWVVTRLTKGSMRRFGFDPETHPVYRD